MVSPVKALEVRVPEVPVKFQELPLVPVRVQELVWTFAALHDRSAAELGWTKDGAVRESDASAATSSLLSESDEQVKSAG